MLFRLYSYTEISESKSLGYAIRSHNRSGCLRSKRRQSFNNCARKDSDVIVGFRGKLFQLPETTMTRARLCFRIPLGSRMSFMQIAFRDALKWSTTAVHSGFGVGWNPEVTQREFRTDYDFYGPQSKNSCPKACF